MKIFANQGFTEFFVALGYKSEVIKRYFHDYQLLRCSTTLDLRDRIERSERGAEDWRIHLMETGSDTMTGRRVQRFKTRLEAGTFMVTYSDGLANVDLHALPAFHHPRGKIATATAVPPSAQFGALLFDGDCVDRFSEKPRIGEGWINGGFMVFEPKSFDCLIDCTTFLETHALEKLAAEGELMAYMRLDFWQCMDTIRDKTDLQSFSADGKAPWKQWL